MPAALADLKAIEDFIALDQPGNAQAFVDRLVNSTEKLVEFLRIGAAFKFKQTNFRQLSMNGYRIVYRISEQTVKIIAIIHPSRDIHNALRERKLK